MYRILAVIFALSLLAGCSNRPLNVDSSTATLHPESGEEKRMSDMGSLLTKSNEPIILYSSNKKNSGGESNDAGTGVAKSYLWRAAIESISFMPLVSVDSNGGVIATDWYSSPNSPNEKLKFNILVLNSQLQISSIKVTAFKQVYRSGTWHSVESTKELSRTIEDNILRKAIALKAAATTK